MSQSVPSEFSAPSRLPPRIIACLLCAATMSGVLDQKTDSIARAEGTSLSSSTASFCYIHRPPTPVPHPTETEPKKKFPSRPRIRIREILRVARSIIAPAGPLQFCHQHNAPHRNNLFFFSLPFLQLQNIFRTASEREAEKVFPRA